MAKNFDRWLRDLTTTVQEHEERELARQKAKAALNNCTKRFETFQENLKRLEGSTNTPARFNPYAEKWLTVLEHGIYCDNCSDKQSSLVGFSAFGVATMLFYGKLRHPRDTYLADDLVELLGLRCSAGSSILSRQLSILDMSKGKYPHKDIARIVRNDLRAYFWDSSFTGVNNVDELC